MFKYLSLLILICISPTILAGPFDPTPTDESVTILGYIFGANVGDLYLGGNPYPVLYNMISRFNSIVISTGLIVLGYVGTISTINTAQEGEILGKKWSSVWVPIRSIIGLGLLAPAPTTGYSLIQVTVMWIVLQGIGAADYIWNTALEGLRNGQSPATGTQVDPGVASAGSTLTTKMLNAAVCIETYKLLATESDHQNNSNDWLSKNASKLNMFIKESSDQTNAVTNGFRTVEVSGTIYFGVDNGTPSDMAACGKLKITGKASASDYPGAQPGDTNPTDQELLQAAVKLYQAKVNAVENMYSVLQPLAKQFADGASGKDPKYVPPAQNGNPKPTPAGVKITSDHIYAQTLTAVSVPMDSQVDPSKETTALLKAINTGEATGWISAGSYYFILNKSLVAATYADAKTAPFVNSGETYVIHECDGPCTDGVYAAEPKISAHLTNLDPMANPVDNYSVTSDPDKLIFTKALAYAHVYLETDNLNAPSSLQTSGGADPTSALNLFQGAASPILALFAGLMSEGNGVDPLIQHAMFGRSLMLTAEGIWIGLISGALITTIFAWLPLGFGTGPLAVSMMIVTLIMGIFIPILAVIWTIGASLAIYAPIIPYMIFTLGVLGWLMFVVEAMIAAPLVALGLIIPSNDEMGKLEVTLNLLANVFLRPTLMIFGFILAGRVYSAIVGLISFGMLSVFNTINVTTMFSFVVIIFIYAGFILAVTNTAFSLIYVLPDKIMRWIGGSAHEHTDVSAMQQVKAASEQAGKEVGKGMQESGKMAFKKSSKNLSKILAAVDAADKAKGGGKAKDFAGRVKSAAYSALKELNESAGKAAGEADETKEDKAERAAEAERKVHEKEMSKLEGKGYLSRMKGPATQGPLPGPGGAGTPSAAPTPKSSEDTRSGRLPPIAEEEKEDEPPI